MSQILMLPKHGSALVKLMLILGGLGILVLAGFQVAPIVALQQEYQTFKNAVETRLRSLSSVSIPDTPKTLTVAISKMLDQMQAQYEPQYIQVNVEEKAQRLSVQVWYSKPHTSLVIPNPKPFYVQLEKTGLPIRIVQAPTPTPPPVAAEPPGKPTRVVQVPLPTPTPVPPKKPSPTPTIVVIRFNPATHVTDATFAREVLQSSIPVMVNFWAPWCGYCQKAMPDVDEAVSRFAGQIKIVKVNVDNNQTTAAQYGVRGIPDFVFFKRGKMVGRQSGYSDKRYLFALIQQYM
jgi:thioredoxin 1